MTGSQLVGNTWSFKPITFEESVIFMITIALTIPIIIITSMRTKPPTEKKYVAEKMMIMIMEITGIQ